LDVTKLFTYCEKVFNFGTIYMFKKRSVENIFNFPTLAEAYRVAALDIAKQRRLRQAA